MSCDRMLADLLDQSDQGSPQLAGDARLGE
jgi:hypothetical protein